MKFMDKLIDMIKGSEEQDFNFESYGRGQTKEIFDFDYGEQKGESIEVDQMDFDRNRPPNPLDLGEDIEPLVMDADGKPIQEDVPAFSAKGILDNVFGEGTHQTLKELGDEYGDDAIAFALGNALGRRMLTKYTPSTRRMLDPNEISRRLIDEAVGLRKYRFRQPMARPAMGKKQMPKIDNPQPDPNMNALEMRKLMNLPRETSGLPREKGFRRMAIGVKKLPLPLAKVKRNKPVK